MPVRHPPRMTPDDLSSGGLIIGGGRGNYKIVFLPYESQRRSLGPEPLKSLLRAKKII
jgi:hypothetical protein